MTEQVEAIFDGEVFRPARLPVSVAPNAKVTLTVRTQEPAQKPGEPYAFLKVLADAKLEGPPICPNVSTITSIPTRTSRMRGLFVDTSFAVALAYQTDAHHRQAVAWQQRIQADELPLVTTRAVLLEIGNALSRQRQRPLAVAVLRQLESSPQVRIEELTPELYHAAFELFAARTDKEWSLTDCISILVMQEHGLTDALTADEHFAQAGFRVLLREPTTP